MPFVNGWGAAFIPTGFFLGNAVMRISDGLQDRKEVLEQCIREVMVPSIETNFRVGGRPMWAPYSPQTRNTSGQMLVNTGELKDAATSEGIWTVSDEAAEARLPDGVDYGAFHQFGTYKMSARPFIVMQREDENAIEDRFTYWVEDTVRTSGLI
jgi:phage gpG-like protein